MESARESITARAVTRAESMGMRPQEQVRRGALVYWEMTDFQTSKEVLTGLGLGEYLPRNDAKAALIKALKQVTRGNAKFYRRFADYGPSVRFVVVNPRTVATVNTAGQPDIDVDFAKEITVSLEKSSGVVSMVSGDGTRSGDQEFFQEIVDTYQQERGTIDSNQLRAVLVRFIREKAFGVAMRSRGGIYFVDERRAEALATLRGVFARFNQTTKLYALSMYDEEGTRVAVRDAALEDLLTQIDGAVATLTEQVADAQQEAVDRATASDQRVMQATGASEVVTPTRARAKLATRTVRSQQATATELLAKIDFYREALAERGEDLERRARVLREVVTELGQDIPESVADMLGRI